MLSKSRMSIIVYWILVSFPICAQSLFGHRNATDLCPDIQQCWCDYDATANNSNTLRAICEDFSVSEFYKLPLAYITDLQLSYGEPNGTAAIVLQSLKDTTPLLRDLKIRSITLEKFEWDWLPDETRTLTMSESGIKELSARNCEQEKIRLKKFEILFLITNNHPIDLKCSPNSITSLLTRDVVFKTETKWPKSLKRIKITEGSVVDGSPHDLFRNASGLHIFWATHFMIKDGVMPTLPVAKNLTVVSFQYSNISKIAKDAFMDRNITSINLAGNAFSDLNATLPPTLRRLRIYSNKFQVIADGKWRYVNLTLLELRRNFLTSVPLGLPGSLKTLYLQHNLIETCPREAFLHLTQLKHLDLSFNRITTMPTGIQPAIEAYFIHNNLISVVPGPKAYTFCANCTSFKFGLNKWFCDSKFFSFVLWISSHVQHGVRDMLLSRRLGMSQGTCSNLPEKAFAKEYLEEARKYTVYIESKPFTNCTYEARETLNCTNTNLQTFPNPPPDGLKKVIISGNRELKAVPDFVFAQQTEIKRMLLEEDGLKRIPYGLPYTLEILSLQNNNITELSPRDVDAFQNLANLKDLLLQGNHIKTLLSTDFKGLKSLRWLGMETNDLICNCALHSFVIWYGREIAPVYESGHRFFGASYARCNHPAELHERQIRFLDLYYLYELQCVPPTCEWDEAYLQSFLNCSKAAQTKPGRSFLFENPEPILGELPEIPANAFWESLNISGLELKDEDIELNHLPRLKFVDLSRNLLTKLPVEGLPDTVENLDLSKNKISHLPTFRKVDQHFANLLRVDLRDNEIVTLQQHELRTLLSFNSFMLSGNPLECNCSLTALISWVKAGNSTLKDKAELVCFSPPELKGVRLSDIFDEEFCETGLPIDIEILVTVLVVFAIILTLLTFLLQRVIRRRRYRAQILSGFQKLLQEEACFLTKLEDPVDNETGIRDFSYEAFVAVDEGEKDGKLLDKLIQELEEKRKQRLCVSIRDFMPGTDVADNIVESIRASKRVILVMSKNFVESPWCQYEVQAALAELHQRQKKLLIPILLEDLNGDDACYLNIKTFISLIPTFKAPSARASKREWDKFWNTVADIIDN